MTDTSTTKPKRAYRRKPVEAPPPATAPKVRKARASRAIGFVPEPVREPGKAPTGKLGILVGLLQRPEGATLAVMGEATRWQAHSVRGALSGALKKKHGLTITAETVDGVRTYRLPVMAGAQGAPA